MTSTNNKKNKGLKTKRIYFEDPYQVEFEAKVLKRVKQDNKFALILDQTCFYPESGGQPNDKGGLNGVEVTEVKEEGDQILHFVNEEITANRVKGKIEWERRFDHMQQHTGQHVLSQCAHRIYEAETLSFHLGDEYSTLEIDKRKIKEKEIDKLEDCVNKIIFLDKEIKTYFVHEDKIKSVPLRRPPKKGGEIRVVEVDNFEYSACGGTHVKRTGEIGLFKITKWDRIRDNVRLEFLCGKRAVEDYRIKDRIIRSLSERFTVHEKELYSSIEKKLSELKDQKKEIKKLKLKLADFEVEKIVQGADNKIIKKIYNTKSRDELKLLAINVIEKGNYVVLFGLRMKEGCHIILACSEEAGLDMRKYFSQVTSMVKGKGGGSSTLVEIAGEQNENLEEALEKVKKSIYL
ncbi:MAG: alanyl-tRNA editing protein [Candidatus Aminicenantaceae bacterium]